MSSLSSTVLSPTVSLALSPTTWMENRSEKVRSTAVKSTTASATTANASSQAGEPSMFFQAILESMMQGVLIVNEQREVIEANRRGQRLFALLKGLENGTDYIKTSCQAEVPKTIWRVCQALLSSRQEFPGYQVIPEETIEISDTTQLRIYAQWFDWKGADTAYMLVTLEDRSEMLRNLARWDAHRYELTARETEVWLLKRQGYSYDEIADELYISRNTVKKHLKSINLKRESSVFQNA